MLLFGRIMLGVGIGFGNQAVPLYLSEMAPTRLRGALNMMFQVATTFGIFTANMVNYGTQKLEPWGWRLSLGLAAIPALHPKLYSNKITTKTRTTAATTTIKTKRRSRTDSISIYQRNKRSPEDHDSSRRGFGVGSRSFMAALRFMSIVVIASVVVVL
ncbi:hypothetical protein HRI_003431000 [Hibiscus trionum]|uniref:Major facilitator superfamily (MFS) profile domain-containing protein n=1 Tax=Hibiscus trionum TaxID=183268 RepID=A0A9W7IJ32_HIBTR|nr:hypothetical protein HRI_003431000 [Hibiscus trionum]